MKVALYARVSKADESQNPENQLAKLRRYAEDSGYEVVDEYVDHASGADPNRPALDRVLKDARAGKVRIILAVKLDRVARSMTNFYGILGELETYTCKLHCIDQPEISTCTPSGRLMMNVIGAVAEYERELIRERTIAGLERARAEGKVLGRPKSSVDAERVLELLAEGKSVREVAAELEVSVGTVVNRSKNGPPKSPNETPSNSPVQ